MQNIKKIYYSPYTLNSRTALNSKTQNLQQHVGSLLKIEFQDGKIGYSSIRPWPTLGDDPLQIQMDKLKKNQLTPLTQKSLYFARIDADYRARKENVFKGKILLQNHIMKSYEKLNNDEIVKIKENGFKFIKVKFGINYKKEIEFIKKYAKILIQIQLKLRIDFNSSLDLKKTFEFFTEIKNEISIIDFVEDPCPYNYENWAKIQENFDVNLALDEKPTNFNFHKDCVQAFRVIVLKPAKEIIPLQEFNLRVVFTDYMDHPVGAASAEYEAQLFYQQFQNKKEHCGFLSYTLFDENPYSSQMKVDGAGFGFGNLLEKENWILLNGKNYL